MAAKGLSKALPTHAKASSKAGAAAKAKSTAKSVGMNLD
jgi:hypothetical protein